MKKNSQKRTRNEKKKIVITSMTTKKNSSENMSTKERKLCVIAWGMMRKNKLEKTKRIGRWMKEAVL